MEMESPSPLVQLLEGIHCQRRDHVDAAMNQMRTILSPFDTNDLLLDGTTKTVAEVIRGVLAKTPMLACAVNPVDGSLPLHHAAAMGDTAIAELLLATFPEAASYGNKKGKIPLHFASREGRTDLVRFLLFSDPTTATIHSKKNKLALHFAAGEGHMAIVRQLLALYPQGARTKSAKGKLPLHFAARWGHLDVAKALLRVYPEGIRELDAEGSLPLHDACREGQVTMSEFLFRQYPRGLMAANIRHEIPLFPAVRTGNLDLVIPLIQAWPAGGKFVIRHACEDDNVQFWRPEVLDLILRGAVGNFTNCSLLDGREAFPLLNSDVPVHSGGDDSDSEGSEDSLTSEEDSEQPPAKKPKNLSSVHRNKPSKRPTEAAASASSRPKKRMRLRERRSCRDYIALHSALEGGANALVLKHVLDVHSDQVRKKNASGQLPLHVAMGHCHGGEETVGLVLDKILKPYPDAAAVQDENGCLPLHIGLTNQAHFRLIEALVEANPASGFTRCGLCRKYPVHIAMENNCDLSTIYALLRGDPNVISDLFVSS